MYNALKTDPAVFLAITNDALHIHIGLAIFVVLIFVLRRSPSSLVPWSGVLGFELLNELMDILHRHPGIISFAVGDSFRDVVNTMVWPTVALVGFRLAAARQRSTISANAPIERHRVKERVRRSP